MKSSNAFLVLGRCRSGELSNNGEEGLTGFIGGFKYFKLRVVKKVVSMCISIVLENVEFMKNSRVDIVFSLRVSVERWGSMSWHVVRVNCQ